MASSFTSKEIEQLAVTPGSTIYTAPATGKGIVTYANCTNESTTTATFTIHVVQSGGSLADTNIYVDTKGVAPGASDLVPEIRGCVLDSSDFIIAFGSAGSAMNLKLGIKEIV